MELTLKEMKEYISLSVPLRMRMSSLVQRNIPLAHSRTMVAPSRGTQSRTLIIVQMAGGNDGLNTIVPFTDPAYKKMRPTLAIPDSQLLLLDSRLALHPNLAPLKTLWDQGSLAIIEGVGYPNQSLSHFQAMDVWETLDVDGTGTEGWLGKLVHRWVEQDASPFQAICMGVQKALAFSSASTQIQIPTIANRQSYSFAPDRAAKDNGRARLQAMMNLYHSYDATAPHATLFGTIASNAQKEVALLARADTQAHSNVSYPDEPFAQGLRLLAEAIIQKLGLRIGYITLSGFDTHTNQRGTHNTLMKVFAEGLSAFYNDLERHGKADDVIIMTWSEFGRRLQENGSGGTDHGTVTPMFVIAKKVNAGIFGEPPSLSRLDETGNMKYTTDFRSVYATILQNWLGVSPYEILGGSFSLLDFLPNL